MGQESLILECIWTLTHVKEAFVLIWAFGFLSLWTHSLLGNYLWVINIVFLLLNVTVFQLGYKLLEGIVHVHTILCLQVLLLVYCWVHRSNSFKTVQHSQPECPDGQSCNPYISNGGFSLYYLYLTRAKGNSSLSNFQRVASYSLIILINCRSWESSNWQFH